MTNYEIIRYKQGLNARIIVHNVNRFKLHWHKELELLLVLKGQIQVTVNGRKYQLSEDELFLINSQEVHSTAGNGANIVAAVQIDPDFCRKPYPALCGMRFDFRGCCLSEAAHPFSQYVRSLVADIINEYNKTTDGYQLVIEGLLHILVAGLLRNISQSEEKESLRLERDKEFAQIRGILDYINKHYTEKISLEDLAKDAFFSMTYLSRFFKAKVGLTFHEYLSHIRLQEAVRQIEQTDKLIGSIAVDAGFASTKSFNKVFKDFYGVTPGEYRQTQSFVQKDPSDGGGYMEFDSLQAMDKLKDYVTDRQQAPLPGIGSAQVLTINSKADAAAVSVWHYSWLRIASIGRAYDLLRSDLQQQTKEAAGLLGMKLLRFHGIFSDELHVVSRLQDGSLAFCWQYTDRILDILLDMGLRPFLDLTFMPAALAGGTTTIFHYKGNITPPEDIREWAQLIEQFTLHCTDRYGPEELRLWYFEVWNEPDYMFAGTDEQYYDLYDATVQTLHQIDPALRIAGPSILHPLGDKPLWLSGMIDHLNRSGSPLDCFTFHVYGESDHIYGQDGSKVPRLGGRSHMEDCINRYKKEIRRLRRPVKEVIITEYNLSGQHGNYLLDTMFAACHILYNALRTDHLLDGVTYWTLSDIFEEDTLAIPPFGGGFGLMTVQGIRKPSWYALRFLSLLGSEVIAKGDEYIITRRKNTYQALIFRYAHYDHTFSGGDRSMLDYYERYQVFETLQPLRLTLRLSGMQGRWQIERYELDRTHGSAWDIYKDMGAPPYMTAQQQQYLKAAAQPRLSVFQADTGGTLEWKEEIPVHGVRFLTIKPSR